MENLKILFFIDSMGAGGSEKSTLLLCDYLLQNKVDVHLVVLFDRNIGFAEQMRRKGMTINIIQSKKFLDQVKEIAKIIKKEKPDLVHSVLFKSNIRVRFAKLYAKFFHIESLVNTSYVNGRINKQFTWAKMKSTQLLDMITQPWGVNHFHAVTEGTKDHYRKALFIANNKISVVRRGRNRIINEPFEQIFERRKANEKFILINSGRHEFQKGQIHALRALKLIVDEGITDITLLILGREGTASAEMKKYIQENRLEPYVILQGFVEDVNAYLLQADVFVFPSLFEGAAGAVIEAQSAGLPIVCNDLSIFSDTVVKGENAFFVDISQPETFKTAILNLFKDSALRFKFGSRSLQNFEDNFEQGSNFKRMLEFYRTCVAMKNS